jgi:hypothetical protein
MAQVPRSSCEPDTVDAILHIEFGNNENVGDDALNSDTKFYVGYITVRGAL